jgi:hypothetical protein
LLVGRHLETNQEVAFLNVYGPCVDKKQFWTSLANSGLLSTPNLILGGDLNILLSEDEHWGGASPSGLNNAFYRDLFASNNLIDVLPTCLIPTWRNGRSGSDSIARRLDRFLVSDQLLTQARLSKSWVELPFVSDHAPVFLQLQATTVHKAYPFKFNHHWLADPDFSLIAHNVWKNPCFLQEVNPQQRMVWKLKVIKAHTKAWYKAKKEKENHNLIKLEFEISQLIKKSSRGALSAEDSEHLTALEFSRNIILREEENSWRLRSRATWLRSGDANTKFFHKVASFNRNKKFIWSISSEFGGTHCGQKAIKEEAVSHFTLISSRPVTAQTYLKAPSLQTFTQPWLPRRKQMTFTDQSHCWS